MDNYNSQPQPSMKWHKFLIYFVLWVSALDAVVTGFQLLIGSHYGGRADQAYLYFSNLRFVDCAFGIIWLGIAVYMIYTRFQLAGLKHGAPWKLIGIYILEIVSLLGYVLIFSGIVGMSFYEFMDSPITGLLGRTIGMILINCLYYKSVNTCLSTDQYPGAVYTPNIDSPRSFDSVAQPHVESGYLAVRSNPSWDDRNEIGRIYPGNRFYVDLNQVAYGSGYTYYLANYNGLRGWVNASFLTLLD